MDFEYSKIILFQFIVLIILNKLAYKFNFLDYPNSRKSHSVPTPYVGGFALAIGYTFVVYISNIPFSDLNNIFVFSLIIAIVGLIDDKFTISPISKLLLQSIPVYLLISKGLFLQDLGYYQYLGLINLGSYSEIFTFFCCLLLINSFNYIDGIDGLLSSLFINIFFNLIIFCLIYEKIIFINYLYYFLIPVIVFFLFNISFLKLPKIFLGDSGSNTLGLITGFIMIFLYTKANIHPAILIWVVSLIIYEFLATNISRILNKKKVFQSGKDHLHYQIKRKFNLNNLHVNIILNIANIFLIWFGFLLYNFFGSFWSLIFFILFFFIYLFFKIKFLK